MRKKIPPLNDQFSPLFVFAPADRFDTPHRRGSNSFWVANVVT